MKSILNKIMKGIKNIIFDLGGVILNIDYQLPQIEFKKLGVQQVEDIYSKSNQNKLFDDLETGKINEAQFVEQVQKLSGKNIAHQSIVDAWNSIILDFPLRRLQILEQLQLHYKTFLLSNTNEIHEKCFNTLLQKTCGYPTLAMLFDRIYLSHRVGLRKPNPEIFKLVLEQNNLLPQETLFIDDSIQHIESASSLGLQVIHMKDNMSMEENIFKVP